MSDRPVDNAVGGAPRATGEPWLWDGTADEQLFTVTVGQPNAKLSAQ